MTNAEYAGTDAVTAGSRRLIWKLALPVPLLLLIAVLGIWLALPRMITENAYNDVVRSATQTVAQFKTLRAYYTDNVIAKVIASGTLKPSVDHKDKPGSVPLPATMIHDLSTLLGTAGTRINLYSDYPFPNRAGRTLDGFQREAWAHLTRSPDATFVRRETRAGSEVVRVAIADRMTVAACVNCHNSHPASPKTDWKLGDVRGILEVATVIDAQLAEGNRLAGHLTLGIPDMSRRDEIGAMAQAVRVFKESLIETERLRGQQEAVKRQADAEKKADLTTQEISRNAQQAAQGTSDVSGSIAGVSAAAARTGSAAGEVLGASDELSRQAAALRAEVDRFLVTIRAV